MTKNRREWLVLHVYTWTVASIGVMLGWNLHKVFGS